MDKLKTIISVMMVFIIFSVVSLLIPIEEEATESIQPQVETKTDIQTKTDIEQGKTMTLTATAYCPCIKCCGKDDGITSTGTKAKANHTIAVDPKIIPYGSKVIIDGRTYIAEDCGGAIKNNKIDIFFNTHNEANQWGIKTVEAFVVTEVEYAKME